MSALPVSGARGHAHLRRLPQAVVGVLGRAFLRRGPAQGQEIMAARVGPAEAGFPVSMVWLFVVVLLLAVAVWLTTKYWI